LARFAGTFDPGETCRIVYAAGAALSGTVAGTVAMSEQVAAELHGTDRRDNLTWTSKSRLQALVSFLKRVGIRSDWRCLALGTSDLTQAPLVRSPQTSVILQRFF
jgi:hypothetical protein